MMDTTQAFSRKSSLVNALAALGALALIVYLLHPSSTTVQHLPGTTVSASTVKPTSPSDNSVFSNIFPDASFTDIWSVVGDEDTSIHYYRGGELRNRVAMLIHGGSSTQDGMHWRPHFSFFSEIFLFYALDLPGHGLSPPAHLSASALANTLRDLFDSEVRDNVDKDTALFLVGRSAGGPKAVRLCLDIRPKCRALVLISPAYSSTLDVIGSGTVDIPTLLVWSEDDPVNPFSYFDDLKRRFVSSASQFSVFKGSIDKARSLFPNATNHAFYGHAPELVFKTDFQKELLKFAGTLAPPSSQR